MKKLISLFSLVLALLCSCCTAKPVATTSHERIETQMQPMAVGADTIIIENVFSAGVASVSSVNQRSLSLWRENSVHSVRKKENSVRISSTRALTIESRQTDSTEKLILTLRPDTVYVPYTTYIRSDTIVAPCPTTQAKLTTSRWKTFALLLILLFLILFLFKQKYRFHS